MQQGLWLCLAKREKFVYTKIIRRNKEKCLVSGPVEEGRSQHGREPEQCETGGNHSRI
jgi:hypothetical protein